MSIIVSEPISNKGKADAKRHRDKQKEILREHLPDVIAEESIIKGDSKGKIVKIPIRSLELPRFRRTTSQKSSGIGQGDGKAGDILGSRPGEGSDQDGGGSRPGIDYIETEVLLEEIIEMMLEDLGLPNLQEKHAIELAVSCGYKIRGLTKEGTPPLRAPIPTVKEGIKRFYGIMDSLQKETKRDDLTCYRALKQANGLITKALEIINEDKIIVADTVITPFPIIFNEDQRYHKIEKYTKNISNAVVIAMMDVSGSMSTMKKYLARSALFWLVHFLRHLYDNVEVRFIVHHTEARIVEENEFFKTGESGGTICSSAYSLANHLIDTEYPTQLWNVYIKHFSDGDNFAYDNDATINEVKKFFEKKVNMVGYAEVTEEGGRRVDSSLWTAFKDKLNLTEQIEEGDIMAIIGEKHIPFLGVSIEKKEDLFSALVAFLTKTRFSNE